MKLHKAIITLIIILSVGLFISCKPNIQSTTKQVDSQEWEQYEFTRGGAPIKVLVKLSATEFDLTEFLSMIIELQFEDGVHVTPPYLSEELYSPLQLVENPQQETFWSEEQNRLINRWTFKFEPMKSGDFTIKPFSIFFRLEKEKTKDEQSWPIYQIDTDPIPYKVKSIEITELDDIRDIKGLAYPPYQYWIPISTAAGLILMAVLIVVYLRHQKHKTGSIPSPLDLVNYYQESLNQLEELEKRDLIKHLEFNTFHTELASILRNYLEHHLGLRAKEQTTQEFIQEIVNNRQFTDEQTRELERFLRLSDLVKFATFQPGSNVSENALNNVRSFIKATGSGNEI